MVAVDLAVVGGLLWHVLRWRRRPSS